MIAAVDINSRRLEMSERLGADATFVAGSDFPESFRTMNKGRLADMVILTTGAESAIMQAFKSVDRGGTLLFFAPAGKGATVSLPVNDLFWRNEITLTSSYAANYEEHVIALELIRQRKINVRDMITHRLPLSETAEGFRLVQEAKESIKVIIEP
jgi:L-iditol 2-dehydrogenase